jgi:hypothetical protein
VKIRIDIWGGDCHQNLAESKEFTSDQWPEALALIRERVETGLLCNVLHLDFQASEEMSREHAASLLGTETNPTSQPYVAAQIEWLKTRLASRQLPPGKRDHDTREKWLLQCGMPAANAAGSDNG